MSDAADLYDPSALKGQGDVEMVLFYHRGKIIQRFAREVLFVAYDPKNVPELVNSLLARLKEAGETPVINMPRRKITRAQRDALVTRATLVYRSMMEKGRPPAVVAQHVVDSVLSAIE